MKKVFFVVCLLTIWALPASAWATCLNTTSCTCVTSGALGQCRTCTKVDPDPPGNSFEGQVCSAIKTPAQMDVIACNRAQQQCNGQPVTKIIPGDHGGGITPAINETNDADQNFIFNGVEYRK